MLDNIFQSLIFLFLFLVFLLPFFSRQFQVHGDSILDGLSPGVKNVREKFWAELLAFAKSGIQLNFKFLSHQKIRS